MFSSKYKSLDASVKEHRDKERRARLREQLHLQLASMRDSLKTSHENFTLALKCNLTTTQVDTFRQAHAWMQQAHESLVLITIELEGSEEK